jgi:hypothetical protein
MRLFWKIANRVIVAFGGKIFCESPWKKFPVKLFWEKFGEVDHCWS